MAAQVPESHRDIIAARGFAHVATIGPRGEPHSSPVWYEWDGDHLLFSHTKRRQKYRNLVRDPRVAVSIEDPADAYRYVEIRGRAEIVDDPDGSLAHRLARAYRGSDRFTGDLSDRVIVKVTPERVNTYG